MVAKLANGPFQHPPETAENANESAPVLPYAGTGDGTMVVLARFSAEVEAMIAAAFLESRHIRCKLSWVQISRSARRRLLEVAQPDVQEAINILASSPARKYLTIPEADLPPARALPVETCPKCRSPLIGTAPIGWKLFQIALVLIWIPIVDSYIGILVYFVLLWGAAVVLALLPRMKCKACKHRWKGSPHPLTPLDHVDPPAPAPSDH
jgi:hypothetical protein